MVSAWQGCVTENRFGETVRTRREALECANSGFFGTRGEFAIIESVELLVDGVTLDSIATHAKLGALPAQPPFNGRPAAIKSYGAFLAPNTLALGTHTATVIFHLTAEFCAFLGTPFPCNAVVSTDFDVIPD